ncbi:MAG: acyltransferase family protein, partial [Vulcanimicrobiaceae bacterium]
IRALAIALVFLDHVGLRSPERSALVVALSLTSGGLGVAALFVLSGFLLSVPYLRVVIDRDRVFPSNARYAQARFLRIYPLYAFAVVTIAIFIIVAERHATALTVWDVISHLTFLNDFRSSTVESVSPVFWTMAVDVGFYVLLPLGAMWAYRRTAKLTRASRMMFVVRGLTVVIVGSIVYRIVAGALFHPMDSAGVVVAIRNVPGMAGLFAIGIIAQVMVRESASRDLIKRRSGVVLALGVAGIGVYFLLQLLMVLVEGIESSGMLAVDDTVAAIGAASVVLFVIAIAEHPLSRFLSSPVMVVAASLSYGWYLFHPTALDVMQKLDIIVFRRLGSAHPHVAYAAAVLLTILALFPFCYAIHLWIEKPFLRKKDHLLRPGIPTISESVHVSKNGGLVTEGPRYRVHGQAARAGSQADCDLRTP